MSRVVPGKAAMWGRVLTAVPLGYAVTSLIVMALARLIPGDPAQSTVAAALLSFAIYAALIVYIFAARSARRAFAVTLLIGLGAACVAAASIWAGGRL